MSYNDASIRSVRVMHGLGIEMTVSSEQLREAMARFATGVTVVTTVPDDDHVHGMTANAFASVSLDPPLVLVSISRHRNTHVHIQRGGRFGVNILAQSQEAVARYFAQTDKPPGEEPQNLWRPNEGGSPRMEEALVFLECSVMASHSYGTHTIFIAKVEEVEVQPGRPLLFYEGHLQDFRETL